jgi:hypothetical protein
MNTKIKKLYLIIGITILIFIAMILLFVLFYKANKTINEYYVDDSELYTYFGNQKIDFQSHITFSRSGSATELKVDGEDITLGNEPLYFKDKKQMIIPNNLIAVFPLKNMSQKKANYYSVIKEENDSYYLFRDDKKIDMANSFLYDGNDLYVFLEDTVVSIGDKTFELSAFSYLMCIYDDELYMYDYETKSISYVNIKEESDNNVYVKSNSFLLNVNFDYLKFNDKSILLSKNIESLNSIN